MIVLYFAIDQEKILVIFKQTSNCFLNEQSHGVSDYINCTTKVCVIVVSSNCSQRSY